MWKPPCEAITVDSTVGGAAAAVLCTVWAEHLSSGQAEVASETLCWTILPILVAATQNWPKVAVSEIWGAALSHSHASATALWTVAACLAAACCYRAEIGVIRLFPALTPLVLIAESRLHPESRAPKTSKSPFSFLTTTVWGTALIALAAVFVLAEWDTGETALSAVPLTALFLVYMALIPRTAESACYLPLINIEEDVVPLSVRVVALLVAALGVQTVAFGPPDINLTPTLGLSVAKALSWYFTIQTARSTSWCIATAIGTFGLVASHDPFIQSSDVEAVSPVIVALLPLAQIIHMLPKQAKARLGLWSLALLSIGPYLSSMAAIRTARSMALHTREHPIETLIHRSGAEFESLLQRQSKTYADAVAEYRRRYGIDPPPGFEAWYEYATANQSPIIDDFDSIYGSVSPFWRLSGKEVNQVMNDAYYTPDIDLWRCTLSGASGETRCDHPSRGSDRNIASSFNKLLGDLGGVLPDVKFLVNHLDEPRVLIPPASQDGGRAKTGFTLTDLSERPTWDAITKFCAPQKADTTGAPAAATVETYGLPFVTNLSSAMDLCQHPEYRTMHGLFMGPPSFRLIEGLVPVLSTGAPSTMGDILFPSPAYAEPEFLYNPADDLPWPRKRNNLYWAGSTTGAVATSPAWHTFHRQRFVALAQNLPTSPAAQQAQHTYLCEKTTSPDSGGSNTTTTSTTTHPESRSSPFFPTHLLTAAFTRIFQCRPASHCRAQRLHFRHRLPWQPAARALRSRLAFDLDGNGISGRFYRLVRSRSLPLKQTLLREWHHHGDGGRLAAWVHYLPVSLGMGELAEMVLWLAETERGRRLAREVADTGREWFARGMREVDRRVYVWRLVLEMARVADEGRGVLV